jgi:hypothetical protein
MKIVDVLVDTAFHNCTDYANEWYRAIICQYNRTIFVKSELQTDELRHILITETEVEGILNILDTSKATGPDCINPRLLREAALILKYPLCKLFNTSLSLSILFSKWKL